MTEESKPQINAPYYRVVIVRVEERPTWDEPWQKLTDDSTAKPQYAYVAKRGKEKVEREVLRAELTELDIKAVVKAVHGL